MMGTFFDWIADQRHRSNDVGRAARLLWVGHGWDGRGCAEEFLVSVDYGRLRGFSNFPQSPYEAIRCYRALVSEWESADPALMDFVFEWPPRRVSMGHKAPRRDVSPSLRFEILQRDGFRCQLCGATTDDGETLEVDHKLPISRGGSNAPSNLWALCFSCNRGKGTRVLQHVAHSVGNDALHG